MRLSTLSLQGVQSPLRDLAQAVTVQDLTLSGGFDDKFSVSSWDLPLGLVKLSVHDAARVDLSSIRRQSRLEDLWLSGVREIVGLDALFELPNLESVSVGKSFLEHPVMNQLRNCGVHVF